MVKCRFRFGLQTLKQNCMSVNLFETQKNLERETATLLQELSLRPDLMQSRKLKLESKSKPIVCLDNRLFCFAGFKRVNFGWH